MSGEWRINVHFWFRERFTKVRNVTVELLHLPLTATLATLCQDSHDFTKLRSEPPLKAALPLTSYAALRMFVASRSRSRTSRLRPARPPSPANPRRPIQPQLWSFRGASSVRAAVGALASCRSVVLAGRSAACPNVKVAAIVSIANSESSFVIEYSCLQHRMISSDLLSLNARNT